MMNWLLRIFSAVSTVQDSRRPVMVALNSERGHRLLMVVTTFLC